MAETKMLNGILKLKLKNQQATVRHMWKPNNKKKHSEKGNPPNDINQK